jgi:hypothetical protein
MTDCFNDKLRCFYELKLIMFRFDENYSPELGLKIFGQTNRKVWVGVYLNFLEAEFPSRRQP